MLYANFCGGGGDVTATDVWIFDLRFNLDRKIPRLGYCTAWTNMLCSFNILCKKKGKAIPLQA